LYFAERESAGDNSVNEAEPQRRGKKRPHEGEDGEDGESD